MVMVISVIEKKDESRKENTRYFRWVISTHDRWQVFIEARIEQ